MAHVDYFLKIEGVPGESADSKHKDEIDLESWSWGVSQGGTMAFGGGGGAGKASFQDFHFVMKANKATPKLMLACASGEHIKKAVLTCRKAGKDQQEFLKITLSDLLVSSYQTGGSGQGDVIPMDQISINYSKCEVSYKEQKADGTLGGEVKGGWDLKANKAVAS
jgi:type VI secretion system secreted protein Hcp